MSTIANELLTLNSTKIAIKEAIINKGVDVGEEDTFASYANRISEISGGGDGGSDLTEYLINEKIDSFTSVTAVGMHPAYALQNGLVGQTGGSYVTVNLLENLENNITYYIEMNDSGTIYKKSFIWEGSTQVLTWSGFELTITTSTAGLTYYSGAWRNIYCDIYFYR